MKIILIENKDKIATKDLLLEVLNDITAKKKKWMMGIFGLLHQESSSAYTGIIHLSISFYHGAIAFSSFDIDEFARVRKIVNELNLNTDCIPFAIQTTRNLMR